MDCKVMLCGPACMNRKDAGAIYQNETYKDKRVFNPAAGESKDKPKWRCTICGQTKS